MKNFRNKIHTSGRNGILSVTLILLMLAGCNFTASNPVDAGISPVVVPDAVPERSNMNQQYLSGRPISGTCNTTFDPPVFIRPPAVFSQADEGHCRLSHLGASEFYSLKEIDFNAGTQKTTEAYFTAANGDVLRASGEGFSSPGEPGKILFNAVLNFEGGTGRFTGATGSIRVEGVADVINRTASFTLSDGLISYEARNRRDR